MHSHTSKPHCCTWSKNFKGFPPKSATDRRARDAQIFRDPNNFSLFFRPKLHHGFPDDGAHLSQKSTSFFFPTLWARKKAAYYFSLSFWPSLSSTPIDNRRNDNHNRLDQPPKTRLQWQRKPLPEPAWPSVSTRATYVRTPILSMEDEAVDGGGRYDDDRQRWTTVYDDGRCWAMLSNVLAMAGRVPNTMFVLDIREH